jgi:hypothetical protein
MNLYGHQPLIVQFNLRNFLSFVNHYITYIIRISFDKERQKKLISKSKSKQGSFSKYNFHK